jgi:hypothetical protein
LPKVLPLSHLDSWATGRHTILQRKLLFWGASKKKSFWWWANQNESLQNRKTWEAPTSNELKHEYTTL